MWRRNRTDILSEGYTTWGKIILLIHIGKYWWLHLDTTQRTGFLQICNLLPRLFIFYESTPVPPPEETNLSWNYRRQGMAFLPYFLTTCCWLVAGKASYREWSPKRSINSVPPPVWLSTWAPAFEGGKPWFQYCFHRLWPCSPANHPISFNFSGIILGTGEQGSKRPSHQLRGGMTFAKMPNTDWYVKPQMLKTDHDCSYSYRKWKEFNTERAASRPDSTCLLL